MPQSLIIRTQGRFTVTPSRQQASHSGGGRYPFHLVSFRATSGNARSREKSLAPSPPSSRSSKAQELQLPKEEGEIFLLSSSLQSFSRHRQEAAREGAARRRSPSRPPAFASSSPKTCLGQPLNICRAAPLAPRLLFRQTFAPVSGPPAALAFSSNLFLLLHPTLQSIPVPTSSRCRTRREPEGLRPQAARSAANPGFGRQDAQAPT